MLPSGITLFLSSTAFLSSSCSSLLSSFTCGSWTSSQLPLEHLKLNLICLLPINHQIFSPHFSFVSCTLMQFSPAGPLCYLCLRTVIEKGFGESVLDYLVHVVIVQWCGLPELCKSIVRVIYFWHLPHVFLRAWLSKGLKLNNVNIWGMWPA